MMAINFNLSDLSSGQRRAGTARRYNTPYTYPLLSATPSARQAAIDDADAAYKQSVLNQEKAQFDTQLAQNAAQYNTSLAQTARQFNENQAMQRAIAEEQAAQAQTASYIGAAQNLATVAALTKDAWLPAAKEALGLAAPKVVSAAAPAVADAVGIAGQTAEGASATGSAVGDTLGVSTGEVLGAAGKTAANVVGNAALYYALGKAAQAGGRAMHENEQSYPLSQFGHNLQDAVSLPGYTETGLNEGYHTVERDGRTFGTYDSDARGTATNIIEGVLPVESGSLGRAARDSIDAAARLNTGDMLDAAGQIMSPLTSIAEKVLGYEPGESNAINTLANPIASVYNVIQDTNRSAVDTGLAVLTGGLSEVFCFAAGTPITLANGDAMPIENIDLFDECDEGGMVNGKGVTLANDLYDYAGVQVTGSHAVYEDGEWKRVKNSNKAIPLVVKGYVKVYIINNENHILIVNGIRFADYGEVTNSEDMTAQERLDYLNEHCRI